MTKSLIRREHEAQRFKLDEPVEGFEGETGESSYQRQIDCTSDVVEAYLREVRRYSTIKSQDNL